MLLGYLTFSSSYCVWIYFCQFSIKSYTCQTNCTRFCSQFAKFYLLYPQKKNGVCKQIENASSSDKTSDLEACLLLKVWRWLAGQPHVYIIHQSYYVHEYNIHDIMYMYTLYVHIFWKQSSVGSFSIKIFEHCLLIIPTTNLGSYNQTILTPVSSFTAQQTHSSPAYTWSQYVSHRDLLKIALPSPYSQI